MTKYRHNYEAFGAAVLRSPEMLAEMARRAEAVKAVAASTAPFDPSSPDGTHYKDSFRVEVVDHGGVHHDRAEGRVINDDPAAFFIEFGTVHESKDGKVGRTPKHRTLGRALDSAGGV